MLFTSEDKAHSDKTPTLTCGIVHDAGLNQTASLMTAQIHFSIPEVFERIKFNMIELSQPDCKN